MTGETRCLAKRLERHVAPDFVCIWCGAHHLHLAMQWLYKALLNGKLLTSLMSLIGYLRRQQNFILIHRANGLMKHVDITLKKPQGMTTFLVEQAKNLE